MPSSVSKIILAIILVAVAAFVQNVNFNIAGVKPNVILAVLLALAFVVTDFVFYGILVFLGMIILRFQPYLNWGSLILMLFAFGSFFAARHMPWRESLNFLAAVAISTVGIYLFIDPGFIFSNAITIIVELAYNVLLGITLFLIIKTYYGYAQNRFRF